MVVITDQVARLVVDTHTPGEMLVVGFSPQPQIRSSIFFLFVAFVSYG
jgi:hypothetical protein